MISLATLKNSSANRRDVKRVGRGPGSGKGKTCGRGEKGAGSRSGYKRRYGYEGGQFRTFMKLPIRGFSNAMFKKQPLLTINLAEIDAIYEDGETVNLDTLHEKGFFKGNVRGLKILGNGELTKKVTIEAVMVSAAAKEKLRNTKAKITLSNQNDNDNQND